MNPRLLAGLALGVPVGLQGAWHSLLGVVALPSSRKSDPRPGIPGATLAILVPAHNEEALLVRTIESLLAAATVDTEIIVIADNCSDATADIAREMGVTVLERFDASERGKNYALDFAIRLLAMRAQPPSIVAVVDADTIVSPNFADEVANAISSEAAALQVHYRAPMSTRTLGRIRRLALALAHWSRPLGASRLGLGTSLKGNGMAFSWEIARGGIGGHGITEDAAFTLSLTAHGIAVRFVPGAWVEGFMAEDYAAARVQDDRWERGRRGLLREAAFTTIRAARRGDFAAATGAAEVATLPLSIALSASMVASLLLLAGGVPVVLALTPAGLVAASVAIGWAAARVSPADLAALGSVPRFVAYKLAVTARGVVARGDRDWVRTSRS